MDEVEGGVFGASDGRVEYFYHENLPNAPTPSPAASSAPVAEPNALNQAQQVLQPAAR